MSATNLWRLLSLACLVTAAVIMAPACMASSSAVADEEARAR